MVSKMPNDDIWELIDNDSNSQHYGKKFKFDFSYIYSTNIKEIMKKYIWHNYKTGSKTVRTLSEDISCFKIINEFLNINKINYLRELTNYDINKLISYVKTILNPKTKVPYSTSAQRKCYFTIKKLVMYSKLYCENESPSGDIFIGTVVPQIERNIKIDFIPDDVLSKINIALTREENPYIKYGIIILQSTGMRIGDMLKLTIDSIKPHIINGYTLTWYEYKTRTQRQPMPVTNECKIAINKLIAITEEVRKQANEGTKKYIFIKENIKSKEISPIERRIYSRWLKLFIEQHNIRGIDGELYNIKTHQFRRTLATDMLSKGTDINIIRNVLGQKSATTTSRYYADIKDKERAEIFKNIGIIGNINKIDETFIADKKDLIWFKENKDKGARMEDGYCTKPCSDGKICDRLLKRQKCYTCSRYITTPEYLQAHKNHLAELEKQLEGNIYGDHYAEHFLPTIKVLKEIVKRLEEIQDGNN